MNPEFKRNLWLEISPARLILLPAVIGIVWVTVVSVGDDSRKFLFSLTQLGVLAFSMLWGSMQASHSLSQEFADGTWDGQRMSALTPWQITWGKLFGSTFYAWYGALWLLPLQGIFALQIMDLSVAQMMALLLLQVVLMPCIHAVTMLNLLIFHRKTPERGAPSRLIGIVGILFLFFLLAGVSRSFVDAKSLRDAIEWWGQAWSGSVFIVASAALLTCWSVLGLWELMRRELMLPARVWPWAAFLLFALFWSAGFIDGGERSWYRFFVAWSLILSAAAYAQILMTRKDRGMWLRLLSEWKKPDQYVRAWSANAHWLVTLAFAIVVNLVALFYAPDEHRHAHLLLLFCCAAFVVRDVCWMFWLNLVVSPRRADGAAALSLVIAYGVLPFLFHSPTSKVSPFAPPFHLIVKLDQNAVIAGVLFSALIQAALVAALFYGRWRREFEAQLA